MKKPLLILGAGGTGGHMFPAESISMIFKQAGYEVVLMTDARGMRFAQHFSGCHIIELPAVNMRTKNIFKMIIGIVKLKISIFKAFIMMLKNRPKAVIGFGGYPSFPAAMGAVLSCTPLYLHEQNAIIGRTNKVLRFFARKILCSFPKTQGLEDNKKAIFTGNPVRTSILNYHNTPLPSTDNLRILITGGSQGARIFTDILPEACSKLATDLRSKIIILHQTRPEDVDETKKLYQQADVTADVVPFIHNMAEEIAQSHLVICRSGASTLSELAIIGRPSIMIPLPTAADDQQTINATVLMEAEAGKMIPQKDMTALVIASLLTDYLNHPEKLSLAAQNALGCGKHDAREHIFNIVRDL